MRVGFLVSSVSREAGGLFQSVRGLAKAVASTNCKCAVFGISDEQSAVDLQEWQPLSVQTFRPQLRAWGYSNELVPAMLGADLDVAFRTRFVEILLGRFATVASANRPALCRSSAWDAGTMGVAECEMEETNRRAALRK